MKFRLISNYFKYSLFVKILTYTWGTIANEDGELYVCIEDLEELKNFHEVVIDIFNILKEEESLLFLKLELDFLCFGSPNLVIVTDEEVKFIIPEDENLLLANCFLKIPIQ